MPSTVVHAAPADFAGQWILSGFPSVGRTMPSPKELHIEFVDPNDGATHRIIIPNLS